MKTQQPTALDLLKEELMSQYDLTPDQISFELRITGVEKEKARQIAADFSRDKHSNNLYRDDTNGYYGYGKIPGLWVWAYFKEEEEAESDEE
jgi:hypothetical protein